MSASDYKKLTEAEQAHWNEYCGLRALTDWPGYDKVIDAQKLAARTWLVNQRAQIEQAAQSKANGGDGGGWKKNNRKARFDFLGKMNSGAPKHQVRLPAPGSATDAEKVYLEAREIYLAFTTTTPEQKERKLTNVDWLVERRKSLWRLMATDPKNNKANGRQERYDALCIATHFGKAYEAWDKTHNKWGVPLHIETAASGQRADIVRRARSYIGVVENPAGSNKGTPQPSGWQKRVIGSDGWAWCACFAVCMAWDAGVKGAGTAGVWNNIQLAKQGKGMYRGFTTDYRRVRPGDHVAIGCETCHQEVVVDFPTATSCLDVGGNTAPAPGSGNEYNGGCVADRTRSRREIVGYLLVRTTS